MPETELLCLERTCSFCGAGVEVTAAEFAGEPQPHTYTCPECGKPDELVSTGPAHVRLLRPRSDGRTRRYEQTLF